MISCNDCVSFFKKINDEYNVQQVLLLRRTGGICPASLLNGQWGAMMAVAGLVKLEVNGFQVGCSWWCDTMVT